MKRLAILVLLLLASGAEAYTCGPTGCTWNTSYTEPSTLTNGQALTDLTACTATYTVSVDGGAASGPKTFQIPASRPQGGSAVSRDYTDTTMIPGHTYAISETVACTSSANGTGSASAPATKTLNNGVTVPPPAGVTIQ